MLYWVTTMIDINSLDNSILHNTMMADIGLNSSLDNDLGLQPDSFANALVQDNFSSDHFREHTLHSTPVTITNDPLKVEIVPRQEPVNTNDGDKPEDNNTFSEYSSSE